MSNNIAVSITADVADLQVKRAVMSAELKQATKDLNAFAKEAASSGSTEALREGMLASANAAEQAKASIARVNAEIKSMSATAAPAAEHVEHGFAGIAASAREMAAKVGESVTQMREMRESLIGFGELMMAAFAVEEIHRFAEAIAEAAEKTFHVSQQLGLTMAQTQGLAAAAAAVGIPFDALTKGLGQMDLRLEKNPKLFRDLGIQIPQNATQMQALNAVMDRFNGMADGPNKTAMSMALMGRAGKELIPFLNEGSEGLGELVEKAREYGAVNEVAAGKGVLLAESLNEGKLAMLGLKMTLSDAFAPLLTEVVDGFNGMVKAMTESYNTGGAVKVVLEGIVEVFQGVGEILDAVGSAFSVMFSGTGEGAVDWASVIKQVIDAVVAVIKILIVAIVTLVQGFKIAFDDMVGQAIDWYGQMHTSFQQVGEAIDIMKIEFQILGTVVYDSLTLQWSSIAADWDAGMAKIDGVVRERGKQIADDARSYAQQAQGWFASADGEANKLGQYWAHVGDKPTPPKPTGIKMPTHGTDHGGDLSTAGQKGKKGKSDKPSIMEGWKAALAEMLADEKNFGADDAELTLQFWTSKLALVKKGSKEEAEVRREVARAKLALLKEEGQDEAASIRTALALKTEAARADVALAKIVLQEKISTIDAEEKAGRINAVAAAQQRAALNAQLYRLDADLENRLYALNLKALQDEAQIRTLTKQQRDALNRQIEVLEAQHLNRMRVLNSQNEQKMAQDEQKVVAAQRARYTQLAKGFGDAIAQMVTFQKGFASTLDSIWKTMLGGIQQSISRMVEMWLVSLVTKEAASKAFNAKQILADAKAAATGAYRAVVGIPIIGPILAPIAAATAFAGVMAFSAEGGMDRVPYDGAITELHKDEMVLSSRYANPLRDMLGGSWGLPAGMGGGYSMPAANNNAPSAANQGGGGGDMHLHLHGQIIHGPGDIQRWAKKNAAPLVSGLRPHMEKWK